MDFGLPEELKMIQSLVKDFVTDQLKPLERELLGRAAGLADARRSLPPEVDEKLMGMARELGLWGLSVPEELGGVGLGTLGCCLAEEELAQTIVPFTFGDVSPMLFECNEQQKERYFLPVFNRQREGHIALMEPGERLSHADMETRAERTGGTYIINGRKLSFSAGSRSDYFAMVYARTSSAGGDGVTCFLVEGGTPGFSLGKGAAETGWRSQVIAPTALMFRDCAVPAEAVLGEEGRAFHLGRRWLPSRRIVRGARSVGVAQRLLEEASTQAQSWQSFGQFVSRRLDIESALADVATDIHACRLVVHEAACKSDEGQLTRRGAAVVKVFASGMLGRVADRVAHVFNGPPYLEGLAMEKLCRDVMATRSLGLAMELQRSIIAGDILKGLKV